MKKIAVLFGITLFSFSFSQPTVELFEPHETFYEGGFDGMFQEMVKIAKDKNMEACASLEIYYPSILVNPDKTINIVKDFDAENIAKNKCAFEFTNKILPHLKNWKTLQRKGASVAAIAKFKIHPFYITHSEINPKKNKSTSPIFSKGINQFRWDIADIFSNDLKKNKDAEYVLTFIIDEKGEMKDIDILVYPEDDFKNKKDLISQVSKIRGIWTPGTFNTIPAAKLMRLPIKQEFNMSWEKQIQDEQFKSLEMK